MPNLAATYMGLELANPIIAGASKLTSKVETIEEIEAAGAAALVCPSLFEEQIRLESLRLEKETSKHEELDAEISGFFPHMEHSGPKQHLMWVKKTKETVKIPVIASLNAIELATWLDYAQKLEDTGADGLELNFYYTPSSFDRPGHDVEMEQADVLHRVRNAVNIPVGVKLSYFYSNPLHAIAQFDEAGADGIVLFNRLFENDIDPDTEEHSKPFALSQPGDSRLPTRFVGLAYGHVKAPLCANTGIFAGADVAKAVLAGASAVQIVSTLYENGTGHTKKILADLDAWMDTKSYGDLAAFQGKLAQKNVTDPFVYKRAQYVDLLLRSEELLASIGY